MTDGFRHAGGELTNESLEAPKPEDVVPPPTEHALTALRFCASTYVSADTLEEYTIQKRFVQDLDALCLTVERKVWSKKIDETVIRYPATWWDAFKQRWFPEWARERWPVLHRCHSWEAYHTYPGLLIKGQAPRMHVVTYELPREAMEEGE